MDEYILMAKEKHGYNMEQVRAVHQKQKLRCLYFFLSSDLNFSWFPDFWLHQALGMLLWHKHDVERSLADLANFTPFPDEWTVEDKVLFEQAFSFHGKSFHRIQQMVRDWERHTCTYHPKYLKRVMKSKFSFFRVCSFQTSWSPAW